MRVAFFSESSADEAALAILVSGILGTLIEPSDLKVTIESRGTSSLDKILPTVIQAVYYNSDAEALVIVSDSDDNIVHNDSHNDAREPQCRLCQLRKIVDDQLNQLKPVPLREKLKVAIGVPVPAIEAWYLCGVNPNANEATWIGKRGMRNASGERKKLKLEVYKTIKPHIALETEKAVESAQRLVSILDELEQFFPQGFGTFANEIRSWK